LTVALTGSAFLYLSHWGLSSPWIETPLALLFFALLLRSDRHIWFWSGFFIGLLWFGWIGISFLHYGHPWAVPLADLAIALVYALYFWIFAFIAEILTAWAEPTLQKLLTPHSSLLTRSSWLKAAALLAMSYAHPFGFDWFKPELTLIHTPFGIDKLHFALLLTALLLLTNLPHNLNAQRSTLNAPLLLLSNLLSKAGPQQSKISQAVLGVLFLLTALHPASVTTLPSDPSGRIALAGTRVPVEKKWNPIDLRPQINTVFSSIDQAILQKKKAVILPESVLPIFLNREPQILHALLKRSKQIDIVLGALYYTHGENRNSAYFFHDGNYTVANKVVLVPFGEANPLPHWASRIVNRIFFDGAPDYKAAKTPTDFVIDGKKYRAAVCYEGTSEKLYRDRPERLILLSNNGWFIPSVEPTLQRLLLEYTSRKYGTTIYHSVNMAPSYVVVRNEE